MKKTLLFVIVLLCLSVVPALADLPWADSIIHTNPVLERGLGPEMVTPGYSIVPLTSNGRFGEEVTCYESWMTGRSGEKVWVRFRPGEAVEAKMTGYRNFKIDDQYWIAETWEAKRIVRCGNPTNIVFYNWKLKAVKKTVIKTEIKEVALPCPPPPPPPPPVVNNYYNTYNVAPSVYPSGQMLGVEAPMYTATPLIGVSLVPGQDFHVSAKASSNNINNNANTNVNANNNVVNVGDGSAEGGATGSGDSNAGSHH